MSCKYQNIFGKPDEGAHKYRIFGLAAVDSGLTLAAVILIALLFRVNFFAVLAAAMVIAVLVHKAFCVNTLITKAIFGPSVPSEQ